MNELKALIVGKLIDIAGQLISNHLSIPNWSEYEKAIEKVYGGYTPPSETKTVEQTTTEVKGIACLPCSKSHISTASSALNEALRFARDTGLRNREVVHRIGIAVDELNIMERIDLTSDKISELSDKDREKAYWILNQSRNLRHMLDDLRTVEDLEKAAAYAAKIRDEFLLKIFDVDNIRDNKEKIKETICSGLPNDERKKCVEAVNNL